MSLVDLAAEQRKAQAVLAERDRQYRDAFENAPVAVCWLRVGGDIIEVNPAFERLLGYARHELIGRNAWDFVPEEDRAARRTIVNKRLTSSAPDRFELEHRFVAKDGATRWVHASASAWLDDADRPARVIVHYRDVTERRQAEIHFRNLVEGSLQGIMLRANSKTIFVNEALCRMFGYSAEELSAAEDLIELHHPSERKRIAEFIKIRRSGDSSVHRFEARGLRKDGTVFWLEEMTSIVEWYGQRAVQFVMIDISERKRAEQRLIEREQEYRETFDSAPIAIYRSGADRKFMATNRAFREMLGYSADELAGKGPRQLMFEEEWQAAVPLVRRLRDGEVERVEFEHRLIRKDGSAIWVVSSLALTPGDEKQPPTTITHVQDVTERRMAQAAVEERDALYRTLVENSIQGVLVARRGVPLFVNGVAARMYGYNVEEMLAMPTVSELFHPDERQRHREFIRARQNGDRSVRRFVARAIRKDGTTIWTEQLSSVIDWRGESASQIVIVDITERKDAERRLADSETMYRATFHNAPVAMIRSGLDRKIMEANRAFQELLGYSSEELKGLRPGELTPPDELQTVVPRLAAVWNGEIDRAEIEHQMKTKDGRMIVVSTSACLTPDSEGKPSMLAQFSDVTWRRRAERLLEARERKYRDTFENAPVAMLRSGRDRKIIEVNRAFADMLGYPKEEVIGKRGGDFVPDDDIAFVLPLLEQAWRGEIAQVNVEHRMIRKDGNAIWVSSSSRVMPDEDDRPDHMLAQFQDVTGRRAAEETLRQRETTYRGLVDNSIQGILVMSVRTLFVNEACCRMFGCSVEEFLAAESVYDFYHPDDRDMLKGFAEMRRQGDLSRRRFEVRGLRKDGSVFWLEQMSSVIDWNGTQAVQVVMIDITERKGAEQLLAAREKKYREIFENAPVAMFRIGRDRQLIDVNRAFETLLGYTKQESQRLVPGSMIHADDLVRVRARTADVWSGKADRVENEYRMKTKDGRVIWVYSSGCLTLDDTGESSLLVQLQDITERQNALAELYRSQQSLMESERHYRELFENAPVAMAWVSPEGRYMRTNRALQDLLGYSAEELLTINPLETVHPKYKDAAARGFVEMGAGRRDINVVENQHIRKDGRTIWVLITARLVRDEQGRPRYRLAQLQDITARKNAEEQLFQSQKMEALGNLAGGIAHDFNNMLLPIVALTEITKLDLPPDSPAQENLASVLEAAGQASQLVQQILTFSRQNEREVDALRISDCVRDALRLLRNVLPATIKVIDGIESDVGIVMADRAQLQSVIMNLGTNAAHAMAGTIGELEIALARATATSDLSGRLPALHDGADYAKIEVRDTGTGMDRATLEKIFNPFFTTKPVGEGTGLGLSMVHGIVEGLDGAIDVHSEVGVGTKFDIYLPLCTDGEGRVVDG